MGEEVRERERDRERKSSKEEKKSIERESERYVQNGASKINQEKDPKRASNKIWFRVMLIVNNDCSNRINVIDCMAENTILHANFFLFFIPTIFILKTICYKVFARLLLEKNAFIYNTVYAQLKGFLF